MPQADLSQSEIRVKAALDQMAVISTQQTSLRNEEEVRIWHLTTRTQFKF